MKRSVSLPQKTLVFPRGFYWGASTASYQVSGCENTQWAAWGRSQRRLEDLTYSGELRKYGLANFICGNACEHDKRFREDYKIAQFLGHNAARFGAEPANVMPAKNVFDDAWLAHYKAIVQYVKTLQITPFFNLWHWTIPVWWEEEGGWTAPDAPTYFARYVKKVVETLGEEVEHWITLNETNVFVRMSYLLGQWPPQKKDERSAALVFENLIKGHKRAYEIIKRRNPHAQVGMAQNLTWNEMSEDSPAQREEKQDNDMDWNWSFLDRIKDHQDFVGVNHYGRTRIGGNENKIISDMGWELYPEAMYHTLVETYKRYQKPIAITENGVADAQDTHREQFLLETLKWVHQAILNGVSVFGYLHWSLIDNFEWAYGFWPRFGLIEIDRENGLERKIRPSALLYGSICRKNAITQASISEHETGLKQ